MIKAGMKVEYIGTSDAQVRWGNNADPRGILKEGETYTVKGVEVHTWHTKVYLVGVSGAFNSCSFKQATTEGK